MPNWDTIVGQHGRLVWRTAYRLLGNHADAGDCFQETFLSALSADRRQPVVNWGGFLQRLATARALDRLRHRLGPSGQVGQLVEESAVLCSEPAPPLQAEAQELNEQLRHALAGLPPKQAEALCLHYLEQWSYQEVGQHLGIATNAVGSLLHRARSGLRNALSVLAIEPESRGAR